MRSSHDHTTRLPGNTNNERAAAIDGRHWAVLGAILLSVLAIYHHSFDFPYLSWDDPGYVWDNDDLAPIGRAQIGIQFSTYVLGNYHPLTMLSYATELSFFGRSAHAMHITNVVLHLLNTALVFLLACRILFGPVPALFAAAIWALHPMRAESVAWIAARKDLLMLLCGLGCLLAWMAWLRSGQTRWYLIALLAFAMSLLSKAMAVSLVPTLFLFDQLAKRPIRSWPLWKEKIPFILLGTVAGLVALQAQAQAGAVVELRVDPIERILLALTQLAHYAAQQAVPLGLSSWYGYPPDITWQTVLPGIVLCAAAVLWARSKLDPIIIFGAMFFLVNIAPVIQLVPVGYAVRADRYTYLAGIGWSVLLVHLWYRARATSPRVTSRLMLVAMVGYLGSLAFTTHRRTMAWSSSGALYNDMVSGSPHDPVPLMNRAVHHMKGHRFELAMHDLERVDAMLATSPPLIGTLDHPGLEPNLLYAKMKLGRYDEVIIGTGRALGKAPRSIDMLNMRAYSLLATGDHADALKDIDLSASLGRGYGEIWALSGWGRLMAGDTTTACEHFRSSHAYQMVDHELAGVRDSLETLGCKP